MASNFPTSLDNFSNPTTGSKLDSPSHAGQHGDANDAIEGLERKIGIGSSTAGSATAGYAFVHSSGGTTAWSQVGYQGITSGTAIANQVLTSQGGGTAIWSTPTAVGLVLISTTSFSGVSSQPINDVFSTTYDNYRILINATTLTGTLTMRFRVAGADSSAASYKMDLYGTTLWTNSAYGGYQESGSTLFNVMAESSPASISLDVLNPFATQKTFLHGQTSQNDRGRSYQGIFDATTSFTGFSLIPTTNITGTVSVYGYAK
jgi:hypothetical protein